MNQRMIIMDLDGTLLRKNKTISEYTKGVIDECRKRNIKIVFATARPERTTLSYVKMLEPDAVVSNNGAKINFFDDTVQLLEIKPEDAKKIISQLLDKKLFVCIDYEKYSLTNCLDYQEWGNWNAFYTPDFSEYETEGIQKISVRAADLELFSSIDFMSLGCNFYANQSDSWYMITRINASKASAIKTLTSHYDIPLEQVVAFGDDQNDMEMLQTCGIGVAMENSIIELKMHADYICSSNENDGVAKWIEENLINRF